ncbi:MAG: pyruvate kinase [Alphaproteobacteria bacterium]|nr:pyruvate kinase [Alphaproteobacteria bacterium]
MPFTKIIATLGPRTDSQKEIQKLVRSGVNVFRLNFSHGTPEHHREVMRRIRSVKSEQPIGVLCDLQGPKLRVGCFENGQVFLKKGSVFVLDMKEKAGDEHRVCLPHPEILKAVKKGSVLLLNDGQIKLRVVRVGAEKIETKVIIGGVLSDHKGVNVPDVTLPIPALTEKDRVNLAVALDMGADWIALSFVQRVEDVLEAKALIGGRAGLMAKIEKPSALKDLKAIVGVCDAVMVARGDLGVEMPLEQLPSLQKHIVEVCRSLGKPVVIATQMLESMITNATPTRAEVSDIASAVYEGVDCLMLSAETAVGKYPERAVQMMRKTIEKAESDRFYKALIHTLRSTSDGEVATAITSAIVPMVQALKKPACVVSYSVSGTTTLRVASERPLVPILNLTQDEKIMRKLAVVWGVRSEKVGELESFNDVGEVAERILRKTGLAKSGQEAVITAGIPFAKRGNTNILHILTIK